ncbi:hypothetical protein OGAPHI_006457 [Ogataea philodendri]|uniref:Uncharacterized protein n=1 Tax=Ogataea philodendri TaxID=1378263 RepID=A0A9P8T0X0_9ASCO|nr:uncharacterized protein OGAPHI_006457 [Ogataea philodendri]KAH3661609.1 hypothetical protein OGAPHI_006457 [Ogataea philodendri]
MLAWYNDDNEPAPLFAYLCQLSFGSQNLIHNSNTVYNPTRAVANNPTHLTEQTHPIETPVRHNQLIHLTLNSLFLSVCSFARHSIVVAVKNISDESSKMNLLSEMYDNSKQHINEIK